MKWFCGRFDWTLARPMASAQAYTCAMLGVPLMRAKAYYIWHRRQVTLSSKDLARPVARRSRPAHSAGDPARYFGNAPATLSSCKPVQVSAELLWRTPDLPTHDRRKSPLGHGPIASAPRHRSMAAADASGARTRVVISSTNNVFRDHGWGPFISMYCHRERHSA